MRKLRAVFTAIVMFAALTSTASTISTAQALGDGGEPPPLCVPGDPGCPR